jgi:hypothetical protein
VVVVLHLEPEKESGGVSVSRLKIPTCRAGDSEIPRKLAESTNADSTLVADALAADRYSTAAGSAAEGHCQGRALHFLFPSRFFFFQVDHMWSRR